MKKKILPLNLAITLEYTVSGIVWLLYGILSLFHNLATSILLVIILLVGIVCTLITFWRKKEAEDEMAKYNLAKAHRLALSKVLASMAVIQIVLVFSDLFGHKIELSYNSVFPFLFGLGLFFIGTGFALYEKVGSE